MTYLPTVLFSETAGGDPNWLAPLINLGGSVVVAGMFLWYLMRRGEDSKALFEALVTRVEIVEKSSQEYNKNISEQFIRITNDRDMQLKGLLSDSISLGRDQVKVITELRASITDIKEDVRVLHDRGDNYPPRPNKNRPDNSSS